MKPKKRFLTEATPERLAQWAAYWDAQAAAAPTASMRDHAEQHAATSGRGKS
jgi:hypothetical protein